MQVRFIRPQTHVRIKMPFTYIINKLNFNQTVWLIFIFANLLLGFVDGALLHGIAHLSKLFHINIYIKIVFNWLVVWLPQISYIIFSLWIVNRKSGDLSSTNKKITQSILIIYTLLCFFQILLTQTFSPLTYIGSNIYGYLVYGVTSFNLIPAAVKYYSSTYLGA
jgi:hypothetical protein